MRFRQLIWAGALVTLLCVMLGQGCGDDGYCCVCKHTGDGTTCGVNLVSSEEGSCAHWCSLTINPSVTDPGASTDGQCTTTSPPPCMLQ